MILGKDQHYSNANDLWDAFHRATMAGEKLSYDLSGLMGCYVFFLLLSIVLQGLAVFVFEGEWFSLVSTSLPCVLSSIYLSIYLFVCLSSLNLPIHSSHFPMKIYLLANAATLIFVVYESQTLIYEFNELVDKLSFLGTTSALGSVG